MSIPIEIQSEMALFNQALKYRPQKHYHAPNNQAPIKMMLVPLNAVLHNLLPQGASELLAVKGLTNWKYVFKKF